MSCTIAFIQMEVDLRVLFNIRRVIIDARFVPFVNSELLTGKPFRLQIAEYSEYFMKLVSKALVHDSLYYNICCRVQ